MDIRARIQTFSERHSKFIEDTSTTLGKRFGEKHERRVSSLIKNSLSLVSSFLFVILAGIFFAPVMLLEGTVSFFRYIASIELFNTIIDAALMYVVLTIECILLFWGYKSGDEKPFLFEAFITKVRSNSQPQVKLNGHSKGYKK